MHACLQDPEVGFLQENQHWVIPEPDQEVRDLLTQVNWLTVLRKEQKAKSQQGGITPDRSLGSGDGMTGRRKTMSHSVSEEPTGERS